MKCFNPSHAYHVEVISLYAVWNWFTTWNKRFRTKVIMPCCPLSMIKSKMHLSILILNWVCYWIWKTFGCFDRWVSRYNFKNLWLYFKNRDQKLFSFLFILQIISIKLLNMSWNRGCKKFESWLFTFIRYILNLISYVDYLYLKLVRIRKEKDILLLTIR